jgi:hypothetical protein
VFRFQERLAEEQIDFGQVNRTRHQAVFLRQQPGTLQVQVGPMTPGAPVGQLLLISSVSAYSATQQKQPRRSCGKWEFNLVQVEAINETSLVGTYQNEGVGRPHVILQKGGHGIYEMHAARLDDGTPVPIEWFVVANCDGTAFESERGDRGVRYILAVQYGMSQLASNHPPGSWDVFSLAILPGDRRVIINGDRVRKY